MQEFFTSFTIVFVKFENSLSVVVTIIITFLAYSIIVVAGWTV